MATATYTPTHCPQTGRKFTRAERKAANKARFKAEMAKAAKAPKAGKRKPAKASAPKQAPKLPSKPVPKATQDLWRGPLMRLTKAQLVDMILGTTEAKPEPASKPKTGKQLFEELGITSEPSPAQRKGKGKRKPKATKTRKATPQERTADKQERAAHGPKGVGPITPQPKAPKADTAKARKAGKAQGERNRTERAKKLAVKWAFDVTYGGMFLPTQQAELKRLLGDVEVSTYEDVMASCM